MRKVFIPNGQGPLISESGDWVYYGNWQTGVLTRETGVFSWRNEGWPAGEFEDGITGITSSENVNDPQWRRFYSLDVHSIGNVRQEVITAPQNTVPIIACKGSIYGVAPGKVYSDGQTGDFIYKDGAEMVLGSGEALTGIQVVGDYLMTYVKDSVFSNRIYKTDGSFVRNVDLAGLGANSTFVRGPVLFQGPDGQAYVFQNSPNGMFINLPDNSNLQVESIIYNESRGALVWFEGVLYAATVTSLTETDYLVMTRPADGSLGPKAICVAMHGARLAASVTLEGELILAGMHVATNELMVTDQIYMNTAHAEDPYAYAPGWAGEPPTGPDGENPVSGWFPHVSAEGKVVSGAGRIYAGTAAEWRNGEAQMLDTGFAPKWIDNDTIVYNFNDTTTRIRTVSTGALVAEIPFQGTSYAADAGWWQVLQQAGAGVLRLYHGLVMDQEWAGRGSPTISPIGGWANFDNLFEETRSVYVNGALAFTGKVLKVSMSSAKVCLSIKNSTGNQVLVLPSQDNTVEKNEDPLIINGPPNEPDWILSNIPSGMLLHPVGSTEGYRWEGDYQNPWARYVAGKFIIVASTSTGVPRLITLATNSPRVNLVTGAAESPTQPIGPDVEEFWEGFGGGGNEPGIRTLTRTDTFNVAAGAETLLTLALEVFPAPLPGKGFGRLVHPLLGTFDYEVNPDEWVNLDAPGAVIQPLLASTRTLSSVLTTLWNGILKDVIVEERWKAPGGLSMPIQQLRMMLTLWTTPIDPDVSYVRWYPNYATDNKGWKVLPVNLTVAGKGITLDDVVNYKDEHGNPVGWVTGEVSFQLKLVEPV